MTGADEQTKDSQRQNMRPPFAKRAALARPFMGMRISNEAKRLRAQGVDVINLSLGQPDYGAPEPVREAMRDLYDGRPLPYSDCRNSVRRSRGSTGRRMTSKSIRNAS